MTVCSIIVYVIIEINQLKKYITDILSAKQIDAERTGNGRRESFRYLPIPRMTNTFIEQGKDKPDDILKSIKKGLYVRSLSSGSVNLVAGIFNFTCRESYLIEDGKKNNTGQRRHAGRQLPGDYFQH